MIETNTTKVEQVAGDGNYGRFVIEPLEPGFGVTVGNAMRRVLLSSLPGAAITTVRVDGVYHEFSDIPEVKEDMTDIILNLKQIRLRSFSDRPVRLMLETTGPGRVTAADIIAPPEVEIVNPEQHIATLNSSEAKVTMEMTVEKGKGYVPADSREGQPIGVIPVDALYTPVHKVNYTIEHTRVGQVTDYDRLVLDVTTDGTITPEDAISQAAAILVGHFGLLAQLGGKAPVQVQPALGPSAIPQKVYDTPIEDLDLSVRAYNCLKRVGITKVGQVLEMTEEDLLGVRNFGRKSLDELREKLEARGYMPGSRLAESVAQAAAEGEERVEAEGEEAEATPVVEAEEEEAEEEEEEETTAELEPIEEAAEEEEEEAEAAQGQPISALDLSVRTHNSLLRAGITSVGQLLEMSEDELLSVADFGRKSLREVLEKLDEHGLLAGSRLVESGRAPERFEEEETVEPELQFEIDEEDLEDEGFGRKKRRPRRRER